MRKVLVVSTVGLIYDGITSVITSYLQAMDIKGLDIYVAGTIEIKPSIRRVIEDSGCNVIEFPNRRTETAKYFWKLVEFIRKNNIEVIHAHGNSGTLAIEMVAAWLGGCKKRIAHSHNTKCDQVMADKILRPIFYLFYTEALACGDAAGKWLFGKRKFEIIANGRDVEKYKFNQETRERIRNSLGINDEIVIGHVGGFFEQKNHAFLVEIYRELKKIEPTCKLVMIGDGPLKKSIEEKCTGLDVIFTGAIDNVSDYLNAMDGMLLPSLFEGLPLVVIEWQINGLPCFVSDRVTKECAVSDNVYYLSLQDNAEKWAKTVFEKLYSADRMKCSKCNSFSIRKAGYDILDNAKLLEKIYF